VRLRGWKRSGYPAAIDSCEDKSSASGAGGLPDAVMMEAIAVRSAWSSVVREGRIDWQMLMDWE
jgi:hypothetical protein